MNFAVLSPSGVNPPTTYSHAVRVGDLVFVAGQVWSRAIWQCDEAGCSERHFVARPGSCPEIPGCTGT
jgi:hypothetical protein